MKKGPLQAESENQCKPPLQIIPTYYVCPIPGRGLKMMPLRMLGGRLVEGK